MDSLVDENRLLRQQLRLCREELVGHRSVAEMLRRWDRDPEDRRAEDRMRSIAAALWALIRREGRASRREWAGLARDLEAEADERERQRAERGRLRLVEIAP